MLEETIGAIATAPGEGAISVIRISGEASLQVLKKVFLDQKKRPITQPNPRYLHLGYVVDQQNQIVDQVLAVYMPKPNSYTGEDVVEIQCHGGYVVTKEILNCLLAAGMKVAEPGEFTQRAFLNGKLNLSQAEAIIDVIQAKSKAALKISEKQLTGVLGKKILAENDKLLDILAQIEVAIDYPEEETDIWESLNLQERLSKVLAEIYKLLAGAEQGKFYREGVLTAIIGPANGGKSTLLNSLLAEERAIVTDIPGTTRDTIEEFYILEGIPFKLVDTAGIRETQDLVEAKGIAKSKEKLEQADLVLLVWDSSLAMTKEWEDILASRKGKPTILLLNKMDQLQQDKKELIARYQKNYPNLAIVAIAAKTGEGMESLKAKILQMVLKNNLQEEDLIGLINNRQKSALERGANCLKEALSASEAGIGGDLIAIDIQGAWEALGEITGVKSSDDILARVFSRFCLGK